MGREALVWNRGDSEQEMHWVPQQLRRMSGNLELLCNRRLASPSRGLGRPLLEIHIHTAFGEPEVAGLGPKPPAGAQGSSYPECSAALGKVGLGFRL